jgi:hypothetical protein
MSSLLDNEPILPEFSLICKNALEIIEIEEQDVMNIISFLPLNKAIAPDDISHKMLESTIFTVSFPLCLSFNRSLNACAFP